jgi:hypothetical protein
MLEEANSMDILNKSVDAQERPSALPAISTGKMSTIQKLQLH